MKLTHNDDYNKAIGKLEKAIADCRFIKRTSQAYQQTANQLRETSDNIAVMLENEIDDVMVKVHIEKCEHKINSGVVSELSWKALNPCLANAFHLKIGETITEVEPTENGIRVKIKQI